MVLPHGAAFAQCCYRGKEDMSKGTGQTSHLQGQWIDSLSDHGAGALLHLDSKGKIGYASSGVATLLGWDAKQVRSQSIFELVHPDDVELARAHLIAVLTATAPMEAEFRLRSRDGSWSFVEASTVVTKDNLAGPGLLLRLRDVSGRKAEEEQLRFMARWFRGLTRYSADIIVVVSPDGRHRFVSGSSTRVLGYSPEELTREVFRDAIHPEDRVRVGFELENLRQKKGGSCRLEYRIRASDGAYRHVETHAVNQLDDPDIHGVIVYTRDITERLVRDPVTELPNRLLFVDRLDKAIRAAADAEPRPLFSVLVLRLDKHDLVRGSLGPKLADQLLVQFAGRLRRAFSDGTTVARLGGDDFAVLLEGLTDAAQARSEANKISAFLVEPFSLAGQEIHSGITAGISLSSRGYDRADAMLRDAQGALSRAQEKGGQAVANTEVIADRTGRLLIEADLWGAVDRKELRLHYQPIFRLADGVLTGFEALLRWQHPRDGLVSPARFIPVAEETGLIRPMGTWVTNRACWQLRRWQDRVPEARGLVVNVNLSARQFEGDGIVDEVRAALETSGLRPDQLKLEVTETILMERPDVAAKTLLQLKDLGVHLALDDFGTGYSSLSYLNRFPFDTLKIDRAFVSGPDGMETSPKTFELVRAIIHLAAALGMDVVAEGIETRSQATALKALGCGFAQGYFLGRPAPPKKARQLIEASAL